MTTLNLFLFLILVVLLDDYMAANLIQGFHPEMHHIFSNQPVSQFS